MKRAHALMPETDPRSPEVVPGMAEAAALRFVEARIAFTAAGDAGHELSRAAWAAWQNGLFDEGCRNLLAAAQGIDLDSIPIRPFERPGALALAGVMMAALPEAGEPRDVITLPALWRSTVMEDGIATGALRTVDLILCDPGNGALWRPTTGLAAVLGWPGNAPEFTDEPGVYADPTMRLHRHPLDWWRAGGTDVAALGRHEPRPACVVDWAAAEAEELLDSCRIICDDAEHAAEIHGRRRALHQRRLKALPRGGRIFVAASGGRAGAA